MTEREIPAFDYSGETKNRIMDAAIKLFAKKGFAAVTTRDIAKAAEINIASIYYYYKSKDILLDDIFSFFTKGYKQYFDWLSEMNKKANSLEEVMDNMFNKEFTEMLNPMACLGMSLAVKEQHNTVSARKCVFDLFYNYSIGCLKADFDRLTKKGIIPRSDTQTIATLFMFCVIVSNDIRVHEYMGTQAPLDCREIYAGLKKQIASALLRGSRV